MSYQTTVNAIRSAAEVVNPTGEFKHGRKVDASQAGIVVTFPYIHLYPFQMPKPTNDDFVANNVILMAFWMQDRPDTSMEERESIIAQMDELCEAFLEEIKGNKFIRAIDALAEPQYQMHNGTVSGVALRFTLQDFTPC